MSTDKTVSPKLSRDPVLYIAAGLWLAACSCCLWFDLSWFQAITLANLLAALVFTVGSAINLRSIRGSRRDHR